MTRTLQMNLLLLKLVNLGSEALILGPETQASESVFGVNNTSPGAPFSAALCLPALVSTGWKEICPLAH